MIDECWIVGYGCQNFKHYNFSNIPQFRSLYQYDPFWVVTVSFFLLAVLNIDSFLQENLQRNERSFSSFCPIPTKIHTFGNNRNVGPYGMWTWKFSIVHDSLLVRMCCQNDLINCDSKSGKAEWTIQNFTGFHFKYPSKS